jgi:hypothetical protein
LGKTKEFKILLYCTEITPNTVGIFTKLEESAANKLPAAGIGIKLSVGSMPLRIEKPMFLTSTGEM